MITQNATFGRTSGSLGNVIAQTIFGKNVLRSKPLKYRDKQSPAQLLQRSKMRSAMEFIKPKLSIFRNSFKNQAVNKSVYSSVLSYYIRNCVNFNGTEYFIEPEFAIFAQGDLIAGFELGQWGFTINHEFGSDCTINRTHPDALDTDILNVLFYNATTKKHYLLQGNRLTQFIFCNKLNLQVHSGDYLFIYTWFQRSNLSRISNSYLTIDIYA